MQTQVEKIIKYQTAINTLKCGIEHDIYALIHKAKVLEKFSNADKKYFKSTIPDFDEEFSVLINGDNVILSGRIEYYRDSSSESARFSMPLAYANGNMSEVEALEIKTAEIKKQTEEQEQIKLKQAKIAKENAERKEYERLQKKFS